MTSLQEIDGMTSLALMSAASTQQYPVESFNTGVWWNWDTSTRKEIRGQEKHTGLIHAAERYVLSPVARIYI
jgi:hypothetical protein